MLSAADFSSLDQALKHFFQPWRYRLKPAAGSLEPNTSDSEPSAAFEFWYGQHEHELMG